MANYICGCGKEDSRSGVSIKFIDGAVRHDIKCECGEYMTLKDPKSGMPKLGRMNSLGQSY
jgi:hypothetical protein